MKTKTKRIYLLIFALVTMVAGVKAAPVAYAEYSDSVLTFKYGEFPNGKNVWHVYKNATDYSNLETAPGWQLSDVYKKVKHVVFDASFKEARPNTCCMWFRDMSELENIDGMRNLNTEDVMVMSSMFRGCSNLKSLDLSNFNTDYVLEMYSMFEGCSALTTLDISTFTGEFVFNYE